MSQIVDEMFVGLSELDRLYGVLKRARETGEDYTLDTVAEPLLATMKFLGALAIHIASLPSS